MTYTDASHRTTKPVLDEDIYSVLRDIMNENPDAKPGKIKRLYVDEIVNEPELTRSFIEELFLHR
jgi:hypothetical protein